ncbi:Exo-poly-alpha-D-galacturonosidase [subsurface metagenome]
MFYYLSTNYASVGDGHTKNTEAFAGAIKACADARGGRVVVPAGIWLTGPIQLKSNINLHLEEGAVVIRAVS